MRTSCSFPPRRRICVDCQHRTPAPCHRRSAWFGSIDADLLGAKGFTHNVASGEPSSDSMLLWTRYVPSTNVNEVRLDAELALDPELTPVVSGGSVRTCG